MVPARWPASHRGCAAAPEVKSSPSFALCLLFPPLCPILCLKLSNPSPIVLDLPNRNTKKKKIKRKLLIPSLCSEVRAIPRVCVRGSVCVCWCAVCGGWVVLVRLCWFCLCVRREAVCVSVCVVRVAAFVLASAAEFNVLFCVVVMDS